MPQVRTRRVHRCIFCDNKPDSKEHLWAEWVLKRFAHRVGLYTTLEGIETYHPDRRAVRVKCVCESCNKGWMKGLEDDVLPSVSLMIQDVSLQLDEDQQATIARWSLKTAMVLEYLTHEPRSIFFTDEERRRLSGSHPRMTDLSFVWLGRHTGPLNFFTSSADAWGDMKEGIPSIQGYVMTLAFRAFVVQVLSVRFGRPPAHPRAVINTDPRFARTIIPIWPVRRNRVAWPPPVAIDDRRLLLEDFHSRIATGVPPSSEVG